MTWRDDPERRRQYQREYDARRPPRSEEYKRKRREYQRANLERNLANQARYRAKKGGFDCDITHEDIVVPAVCPYLGIPITPQVGTGPMYGSPTLDRIDNSKGYVKGNIEVISYRANSLKRDLNCEEMVRMGLALLKRGMQCR